MYSRIAKSKNVCLTYRSAALTAIAICLMAITGCARVELSLNAGGYNKALARAGNKEVLLNAVRASRGYPLHFTSIGDFTGKSVFNTARVMGSIPFVRDTNTPHALTPSVSVQGNISDVKIASINSKEFAEGLIKPMKIGDFTIYWNSPEWDTEFITMMMISRHVVHMNDHKLIETNYKNRCRAPRSTRDEELCRLIKQNIASCSRSKSPNSRRPVREGDFFIYENDPYHVCKFKQFQSYRWKIQLAQLKLIPNRDAATDDITSFTGIFSILHSPESSEVAASREIAVDQVQSENADAKSFFSLRSPGDMIQYVGKLISAQLRRRAPYTPMIRLDSGSFVPLFKINRAGEGDGSVAVGVSFEGERFQVPDTGFDRRRQHQSLQALALINQLLTLKTSRDLLKGNTLLVSN